MKKCSKCGSGYPETVKVCPIDGTRLEEETVVLTAPPIPVPHTGDLTGRTIAARFRIERKLGEGGMGTVYKAEHVKMNRPCAIKILNASALTDPEALPRFTREAQMSSRIDHPHAVTIYDYGESEEGLVYLAMEFVEGETLTDVLAREGKFSLERAAKVARRIGDALDAAHALSIVHRDLKPDNIMLARKGTDTDWVKVLDFGIAKMAEDKDKRNDLTQAGLIIGTPYYMSPEQVAGDKLDPRSDVYSFALIVYEMLAGELPFEGQNTQAVMVSRLTMSPKPLRLSNHSIPPAVEAAVMRGLARERDLRTPTAGQFVAEFEAAIAGTWPGAAPDAMATHRQGRPDTLSMQPPPVTAPPPGGYTTPVSPQPRPPVPPTDPAYGVARPPTAWTTPPIPPQPEKKGGGAGLFIGLALGLLLLVGVAGVGAVGYYQGWFSSGGTTTTAGGETGGGTTTTGTTTGNSAAEAEALFQQGLALQQTGNNPGAIDKYRAAIAKQTEMPKAYRNLGAALVATKQYQEAVRVLETAVKQDPSDGDAHYNLGMAAFKLEQYAKAAEAFKKASVTDPEAHAYAGFAYDNAGDQKSATEEYRAYLKAVPDGEAAALVNGIVNGREAVPTAADL